MAVVPHVCVWLCVAVCVCVGLRAAQEECRGHAEGVQSTARTCSNRALPRVPRLHVGTPNTPAPHVGHVHCHRLPHCRRSVRVHLLRYVGGACGVWLGVSCFNIARGATRTVLPAGASVGVAAVLWHCCVDRHPRVATHEGDGILPVLAGIPRRRS